MKKFFYARMAPPLLLVALCWSFVQPAMAQDNILFIIADDLGVDYTERYQEGSDFPQTPNIDALAQDGILFRNAWANPVCSPTRATILTGQYGFRTGIGTVVGNNEQQGIPVDIYTLPRALDDANSGYPHSCIGKWHLNDETNGNEDNPNIMGFDHYAGLLTGAFDYFNWEKTVNGTTNTVNNYSTTENVDDAIGWISQQQKPWFQWLAFMNPHSPYHKPPNDLHSYDNLSGDRRDTWRNPVPYYKAAIEAMDTEIGRLIAYLKSTGQYENTTIIYLGDNGTPSRVVQPPFNPDQAKSTLYEGGVNVPFIIAGSTVVNPNRESNALVNAVDLFATGLELAGVNVSSTVPSGTTIDSRSLLPFIKNQSSKVRDWAFTELFGFNDTDDGKAIRNQSYKLIRFDNGTEELYKLSIDPYESDNLLDGSLSSEAQNNYNSLSQQLDNLLNGNSSTPNGFSDSNKWYVLKNRSSGLNLRNEDCQTAEGTYTEMYDGTGTCAQWRFIRTGDYWHIQNRRSSLNIRNDDCQKVSDETLIELWNGIDNCAQWSVITASETGYYHLKNRDSGLNIRNQDCGSINDQTKAELFDGTGSCAQWQLIEVDDYSARQSSSAKGNIFSEEIISEGNISVYPNPASNTIFIRLPGDEPAMVGIQDLTGRVVLPNQPVQEASLDISGLSRGLYLVKVRQGKLLKIAKIRIEQ